MNDDILETDELIEKRIELLREQCQAEGWMLRFGDCLAEADAARALFCHPDTLKSWAQKRWIRYRLIGNRRLYRLHDLAAFIECGFRKNPENY
jgi:hypothetical protein